MKAGVAYYQGLFQDVKNSFDDMKSVVQNELEKSEMVLNQIQLDIQNLTVKA